MLKKFGKIALAGLVALTLFISGGIVPDINTDNAIITRANNVTLLSIDKVNSYALLEKTGSIVDSKVDKIRLRFDLYLTETAPGYDNWHIREYTVDEKTGIVNYTGEWVNTPYLSVFVYVNAGDTDDYIKQLAETITIQAYNHYINYATVRNVNLTLNPLLKAQYVIPDTARKINKDNRLFNIKTNAETYTVNPNKTTFSIGGNEVLLAADPIDIGSPAIDRGSDLTTTNRTSLLLENPANDTGVIDTVEIWANEELSDTVVGTLYLDSGDTYIGRDYESIGTVTGGSKQTFTGLYIDVETGDYMGIYATGGRYERDTSGYAGLRRNASGNAWSGGSTSFSTLYEGDTLSIYGTGETSGAIALTITNSTGASNITHNAARLNGELTDDGGATTSVTVYWGDNDGGTTPGNWDNNYSLGNQSEGTFYHDVSSLPTGTTIYYRYYAENASGGDWADSTESFLTKPAAPTNVSATDGTCTDKVVITWTKSTGATGYKVYQDGGLVGTVGDVATYDDTTADAPIITPGTATASDGTSAGYVTLSLAGESVANGTTHTYKVVATNATGDSDDSTTDNGYRGHGSITYQWQVSAADSDASYGNISGATTDPYNHTDGVVDPDGRYYKCIVSATGAANQTSTSDRGYKAIALTAPTITNGTGASNIAATSARLNGELTDDGGATTSVTVYWGDNDGGTTPGNWDNNYSLGNQSEGTFYHDVSSLPTGTTIYYRYYAENASGGDWADSTESFLTKPAAPTADTDTILPDGDGTINQWTASSGLNRYAMVNDGSTATYITHSAPYIDNTFIFARIGSTNYELARFVQGTSWGTVYRNSTTNPATNAAWTWDDVNNAQFGVAVATSASTFDYQYFTFDATSGTGDINYLRFKTTHMRYYTGSTTVPRVAVFEIEVNYTIPIEEPEIESKAASNIAATSARLNARVIDDGGEACEVRFGYGETTQTAANFESYDTVTDWFGAYETGQSPYYDVSGLTQTTTYYFRVQIKNSAGTYTSGELDFTTDSSVGTPSNFNGAPSAASIYLSWTKGAGSTNTVIRYSYSAYPTAVTEGIALYSGASTGYEHTGLTPGKNYYYSIWGESGGVYSASYVTLLVTTDASTGGDGAIDQPEQPGGWFQIPDDSALVNFEPFYSIVNDAADSWDMPRGTLWVTLGLFLSALISVSVFMIAKEILWAGIAGAGMIALITAIGILQLWMAAIIIIIIGMLMMRRA